MKINELSEEFMKNAREALVRRGVITKDDLFDVTITDEQFRQFEEDLLEGRFLGSDLEQRPAGSCHSIEDAAPYLDAVISAGCKEFGSVYIIFGSSDIDSFDTVYILEGIDDILDRSLKTYDYLGRSADLTGKVIDGINCYEPAHINDYNAVAYGLDF